MNHTPSTQAIQERLRLLVCRHCAWAQPHDESIDRRTPRRCEKNCPLFQHVPHLKRTAELLDPSLRNRHVTLRNAICDMARRAVALAKKSPPQLARARSFNRRSDHIARVIGSLFRW